MHSQEWILDGKKPDVFEVTPTLSADDLSHRAMDNNFRVFRIDGRRMTSKATFLKGIAASLSFPEYFGCNWDALEDCLKDMAWLETGSGCLIFWEYADVLQQQDPDSFRTAIDVLRAAVGYWADSTSPLYILVQFVQSPPIVALARLV